MQNIPRALPSISQANLSVTLSTVSSLFSINSSTLRSSRISSTYNRRISVSTTCTFSVAVCSDRGCLVCLLMMVKCANCWWYPFPNNYNVTSQLDHLVFWRIVVDCTFSCLSTGPIDQLSLNLVHAFFSELTVLEIPP